MTSRIDQPGGATEGGGDRAPADSVAVTDTSYWIEYPGFSSMLQPSAEAAFAARDRFFPDGIVTRRVVVMTTTVEVLSRPDTGIEDAGRDYSGNIRLRGGRGVLVAHAAATREDLEQWCKDTDDPRLVSRFRAGLALFDREAAAKEATT